MTWDGRSFAARRWRKRNPGAAEAALHRALEERGIAFGTEYPMSGRYFIDVYFRAERVAVEIDGPEHGRKRAKDAERDAFLASRGIATLRFTNRQVLKNPDAVVEKIAELLLSRRPAPLPASI